MNNPGLLWIDLRFQYSTASPLLNLSEQWQVDLVNLVDEIFAKIEELTPRFLCFEFDYPDFQGLKALKNTKFKFPNLPILMLTEYHSENLSVWAFRTRVWDYLVKPVKIEDLSKRVGTLFKISEGRNGNDRRTTYMANGHIPIELRFCKQLQKNEVTLPAISFIEKNLAEKIRVQEVAKLCHLSPIPFSIFFKKERGLTFRAFLIQFRINKAKEMLRNPHASVTEVAFAVGFNDLSRFTHLFKRSVGTLPSQYRRKSELLNSFENSLV